MTSKEISTSANKVIESFKNLSLGGKLITTPYYINGKRNRDLRAMVGKGTTEEIIMEAKIWEKLKGVDFNEMSKDQIKQFLIDKSIGIDCSGFIVHILNGIFLEKYMKNVWHYLKIPKKDLLSQLKYKLRPVENLGAEVITNNENCYNVELKDVKPGDLIRSKAKKNNSHHIMIVTNVEYTNNISTSITYTHSSPYYGLSNGIKTGKIDITNVELKLVDQNWLEKDEYGINHTFEGFMVHFEDNGLRRLRTEI